jgi:hypothetical protein
VNVGDSAATASRQITPRPLPAGPVAHEELADPTRPAEVVVSYGVGTVAPDATARLAAHPAAYWTRLVWTQR